MPDEVTLKTWAHEYLESQKNNKYIPQQDDEKYNWERSVSLRWCHMSVLASWKTKPHCIFNSLFRITTKKCQGTHWWPVDSLHKGSVIWKAFPSYGVIVITAMRFQMYLVSWKLSIFIQISLKLHEGYTCNISKHVGVMAHNLWSRMT